MNSKTLVAGDWLRFQSVKHVISHGVFRINVFADGVLMLFLNSIFVFLIGFKSQQYVTYFSFQYLCGHYLLDNDWATPVVSNLFTIPHMYEVYYIELINLHSFNAEYIYYKRDH